ncbi:hypothetical protein DUI87_17534 [Hirundo rustica rustica]|uniref:Uncharacterized protein n=1 Tax=Hirundo rustica rustica TaxID=333673 RepID=A0A3M0JYJ6_HIRRU|nr:hypothetical protein DUI87_17534 [Hirundo rustica rustica]
MLGRHRREEELYTGLPESISTELMAVPGPSLGLDAQSDGPVPVLAHRDGPWTSAVGNFCQKTEGLGDVLQVISHGPAESFPEELLQAGDLAEDERSRKRHLRKQDCSGGGYQKEDKEAQGAADCHAECRPSILQESWSEQEDHHLNKQGAKSLRSCCTEIAGFLRNTEERQANVQVTAETLPKLTEEVQGMKADGTRIFSKAGYRNDRVSKGLPPESSQCPDVDTVMARAGVSETSILGFLEPLKVMDIGAATVHPQETRDYSGSKAHAAMPLRPGGNGVTVLEIREEKLPRQNPLNEFRTSFADCQTCQQDEENDAYDYFKRSVPEQNGPHELFSAESCRTLSTQNSEVSCPVLKSICYLDFGNVPLESRSAVHGIINETPQKYLPQNIKHHTPYDHGTGFLENQTSTSVSLEQISAVRNKGLSSAKTDPRELNAAIGKSYSSESEEPAEVQRKIAVGGSTCVDEVFLNSHSFSVEVDKIEKNDNLEGESSSGYNSKEAIIFPEAHGTLARGSLLCENDWGSRGIALHGINDISTGKNMHRSAYTAEKSTATLARDEISNNNMEVVERFDLCKVTGSEIVCDGDEAKEQTGMHTSPTDDFDKTRAMDSPNAPEGNQRNKASEQLLIRYLKKNTCAHNFGLYNSLLGPRKRELNTGEQEEMPLLTADPCKCSTLTCDPRPALNKVNIPTRRAGQTEETLCPVGNQFHPCQSESDVPALGSELHFESLTNQPKTGLRTMGGSVERDKTGPNHSEEVLLKTGGELPLLDHKYARAARFGGALQGNIMGLDSLIGVKNKESSGYMDSISDLIEEKTIRLQEHENRCERNNKGILEKNFSDGRPHCSQQTRFIKCAKEKAELVFARNKTQQSLPKMKWLVENQENTVSAQFLPISSIHGSLSYKPENRNVLSDTENRESLSITPILNNSHPHLTFEPGKETDDQRGIGPSHFGKYDIQESCVEARADSETVSALNSDISVLEKERLCMSPESTRNDNCDSSSAEVFSKDTSMRKILSVTISVKKKSSNIEVPSSGNESAAGCLYGAKSSRVHAHSKESVKGEGLCTPAVKDMDMSSPKSSPDEGTLKNTDKLENINVLSDTENRESLSITPILNNSCRQLTFEPGKKTDDQRGISASHSEKFDIQETSNKTQVDSETMSALNSHISLPEKEKLCMSSENTQRDTSSSDKKNNNDTSMRKILSVTISVKKKSSNIEVPSSGKELAAGCLYGAKSSRVRAHSKESLKGEGLCTPAVKDMDMSSPKVLLVKRNLRIPV